MSSSKDSGEKTEKATPKKLRDARKKGDVAKGRDVTSVLGLVAQLALMMMVWQYCLGHLSQLLTTVLNVPDDGWSTASARIGEQSFITFLTLNAVLILPPIAVSLLIEFLQTGPVFTAEKIKPKMSHLNLGEGLKRLFNMDMVFDLAKNIIRALVLGAVAWLLLRSAMSELTILPSLTPADVARSMVWITFQMLAWAIGFYVFVMLLDTAYRRHAFAKKMRMSMRDIKKESKENDGDPHIKGHRRDLHREWSEQSATGAASNASALIVNPTHVAIAIRYEPDESPVPMVTAKGEMHVAQAMRDAANDANVPVVRNERLARTLLADVDEGDPVPEGLFDIVAEVIHWANSVNTHIEQARSPSRFEKTSTLPDAPGEDLTTYPAFAKTTQNTLETAE